MNNVGEQHRDLLVLRRSADLCDRCTALVTELGVGRQFGTARPTRQSRRRQRAAIVPSAVHVGIVSPLLSDVRHIAEPYPRQGFETLICRLFRDGGQRLQRTSLHRIRLRVSEANGCDTVTNAYLSVHH